MIIFLMLLVGILAAGCRETAVGPGDEDPQPDPEYTSILNLSHLDHLGQEVVRNSTSYRIIHIYAEAPDYNWVGDDDEGIACVDDAARAAVVYLRHYELTGEASSRSKAEALLRFLMYMQTEDGLFYNFVWNDELEINRTHQNSRADAFEWWAARAVWALGEGARVLKEANPSLAEAAARRVERTYPHLRNMLARYGETAQQNNRTVPRWLIHQWASDATSELLLGLVALDRAYPADELKEMIDHFASGIEMMQYGSMSVFPYGAHASWIDQWHGWGNSQSQALAAAGRLEGPRREAEHFFPRLLTAGWMHSMNLDSRSVREFEQIAYATRTVAVGLSNLYERSGERRHAILAGLAAGWLTGNNIVGEPMYDPQRGYGYDGINNASSINRNAGAESTIESLYTILEIERHPDARVWMYARGDAPVTEEREGKRYLYRVFEIDEPDQDRVSIVMNLTDERLEILQGDDLDAFLNP